MGYASLEAFERNQRIALGILSEIENKLSTLEIKIESLQSIADEIESILSKYESSNS